MSLTRAVIVGGGQGGFQAAASLRAEGFAGTIALIGAEPHLPYQRPPLSKTFLKDSDPTRLLLRPGSFYDRNNITLHLGVAVEEVDRAAREVRLSDGTRIGWDWLILATGARNAVPPIPGASDRPGLRTLEDAQALRASMATASRIVIVGAGFIGLELAAVARSEGREVTVIEAADRPMARAVSADLAETFRRLHASSGVVLHLSAPAAMVGDRAVTLADGREVTGDLVVMAAGVRPNVELAAVAGLTIDNGIVVDEGLVTSDPAVFALGDCAAFPDRRAGRRIRLESVQAATDQARHIARRISTGNVAPYDALPWFWSDQGAARLQIAGLAFPQDDSMALPDGNAVLRFRDGHLSAVETLNAPVLHMAARRCLAASPPTRETLAAAGYDLRCV